MESAVMFLFIVALLLLLIWLRLHRLKNMEALLKNLETITKGIWDELKKKNAA